MGNPASHLTEARVLMEKSGYAAYGDRAFRAALFVYLVQRLGDDIIRAEPIHPLQHLHITSRKYITTAACYSE